MFSFSVVAMLLPGILGFQVLRCGCFIHQTGCPGIQHYQVEACDVLGNFPDFPELVADSVFLHRIVLRNRCDHLCRGLGLAHATTQLKE